MVRAVGVEEELLLVDPVSGELASVSGAVLNRHAKAPQAADEAAETDLEGELLQHMVETHTDPSVQLAEVARQVRSARRTAMAAAEQAQVQVAAVGVAPLATDAPVVTPDERYEQIVAEFGEIARAAGTLGMHVHVDCGDPDEQIRVIDGLRPWLPLLVAISANSPFAEGRDTGYASWRHQVWTRWPTAGPAEPFGSRAEYDRASRQLIEVGAAVDAGMLYFDARPSEDFPTVEIRVADVCTDVDDAMLVASLARALVETVADEPRPEAMRTDLLRAAHWRAARDGLAGDLIHPLAGVLVPAREALSVLVDHVDDALQEAGDAELVQRGVSRLLGRGDGRGDGGGDGSGDGRGNGARLQRLAWSRSQSLPAVVADLVDRTALSANGG